MGSLLTLYDLFWLVCVSTLEFYFYFDICLGKEYQYRLVLVPCTITCRISSPNGRKSAIIFCLFPWYNPPPLTPTSPFPLPSPLPLTPPPHPSPSPSLFTLFYRTCKNNSLDNLNKHEFYSSSHSFVQWCCRQLALVVYYIFVPLAGYPVCELYPEVGARGRKSIWKPRLHSCMRAGQNRASQFFIALILLILKIHLWYGYR